MYLSVTAAKIAIFSQNTSMRLKRQAALNDWREKKGTAARCTGCSCLNSGR